MTSSNGNFFRVTGLLCGEFTGHRWIPLTKASDAELWCFLRFAPWINGCVNNREAGDLRRHRDHYDVVVMCCKEKMKIYFHIIPSIPGQEVVILEGAVYRRHLHYFKVQAWLPDFIMGIIPFRIFCAWPFWAEIIRYLGNNRVISSLSVASK